MAYRVLPFKVTIPAGTAQATPATTPISLDNWLIRRLDLEVPPGPAGLMGFQIFNNGVAFIPFGGGQWIVWDDNTESYYLDDQPDASGWSVVGYNAGVYDHAVILRFHVDLIMPSAPATPPAPLVIVNGAQPPAVPVVI